MTTTYTHLGYRKQSGPEDSGMRSARNLKPGKRHALNADSDHWYVGLCGEKVLCETKDMYGDLITPNCYPLTEAAGRQVTCKRCLKRIK